MAETKIEWADYTFNHVIGCSKVSAGCANCYAEADFDKRRGIAQWGPHGTRVMTTDSYWKKPLTWDRKAAKEGVRRRVFCASLADVFEDWQGNVRDSKGNAALICDACGSINRGEDGTEFCQCSRYKPRMEWASMADVRRRLFDLICRTPNLDWMLLTKRPENALQMMVDAGLYASANPSLPCPQPNLWIGTSVENQEAADERIPMLLNVPSVVRFLSCEPLLGPVDLASVKNPGGENWSRINVLHRWTDGTTSTGIDWIIVGGESGPNARPMHPDWARSLRDQCHSAGVPFLFKQFGEFVDELHPATNNLGFEKSDDSFVKYQRQYPGGEVVDYEGLFMHRVGKKAAGRLLDGVSHDGFPSIVSS